jgi:hypothetical protein
VRRPTGARKSPNRLPRRVDLVPLSLQPVVAPKGAARENLAASADGDLLL